MVQGVTGFIIVFFGLMHLKGSLTLSGEGIYSLLSSESRSLEELTYRVNTYEYTSIMVTPVIYTSFVVFSSGELIKAQGKNISLSLKVMYHLR